MPASLLQGTFLFIFLDFQPLSSLFLNRFPLRSLSFVSEKNKRRKRRDGTTTATESRYCLVRKLRNKKDTMTPHPKNTHNSSSASTVFHRTSCFWLHLWLTHPTLLLVGRKTSDWSTSIVTKGLSNRPPSPLIWIGLTFPNVSFGSFLDRSKNKRGGL